MSEPIETKVEKEETPEWATKLQETMESLPDRLSQVLKPQTEQEETHEVTEIPLPEIPQPETPPQESPLALPLEEPEKPKKKSFLGWLL